MKVLLIALNSRINHKAPALWCLKAYCESKYPYMDIEIREYNINDPEGWLIGEIYLTGADLIAFSSYIWNIELVKKIGPEIAKLLPDSSIILGGPEVSFEEDFSELPFADYILKGAGEEIFSTLLFDIHKGRAEPKSIIDAGNKVTDFSKYPSPYTEEYFQSFTKQMPIDKMLVYYESSRGCPFSCAYCLSSVSTGLFFLPLERVFREIKLFVSKGVKTLKFVDRTFNAVPERAKKILEFISSLDTDCTFHFEVAADLFTDELFSVIAALPKKRVQFEIGIQSTNEDTLCAVSRKTDTPKILANIRRLLENQNCHVHVDLIAGLPHDDVQSFAEAFNACFEVRPHMLQLGFLKLLKGSKLRKESGKYEYIFQDFAPYEVQKSNVMSISQLLFLKEIEEVFDKFYNTGMFSNSIFHAAEHIFQSSFELFSALALFCRGRHIRLSLKNSYTLLFDFLREHTKPEIAAHYIKLDCLTYDMKGSLPDDIKENRHKDIERDFRFVQGYRNVRAEYFDLDKTMRIFIYDDKDSITKEHKILIYEK